MWVGIYWNTEEIQQFMALRWDFFKMTRAIFRSAWLEFYRVNHHSSANWSWQIQTQFSVIDFSSSTLLWCQYMGESSRPWIERIFWMAAFTISTIIGCSLLIAEMIYKLQTNLITVSLAERQSFIREVIKLVSDSLDTNVLFYPSSSDSLSSSYEWV